MDFYIDVALNVPLNQTFLYKCRIEGINEDNAFGRRVEVRFGNRKMTGIVIASYSSLPTSCPVTEDKVRYVTRFIDDEPIFTKELLELAKWISYYYICAIGEAVFSMIPSGRRESDSMQGLSFDLDSKSFEKRSLSDEQQNAVNGITNTDNTHLTHYLYGITGSGKTEVFLSAAEKILSKKQGVIYLVPEIGLTPQVAEAVISRFGDTAAVLHSGLTPSQKLKEWNRILKMEARVVVGARSAVFAPVPDLGLIIIDEEHDSSYKSGSSPRYHARQVAMYRSLQKKIPLVMGSATPSVEAFGLMEQGKIKKHYLTKRLAGGAIPTVDCVNLSLEGMEGNSISKTLEQSIRHCLENKRQVILFLNRRGFMHFFKCHSCSFEMKCKNCSISLTYHKKENRLRCHYCGYSIEPPHQCPKCGSLDIGYSGFGTEFIENEVKAKFPNARVIRVDTDSLKKKGELQEKINSFRNGEYDILLGTQMVAKGLNFPNLQLVGVILADTSLHLPDFRAAERTFSLIVQVSGRAGRLFPDGKVIVQSYSPDMIPIDYAVKNKIDEFYREELNQRRVLSFPPYTRLLRIVFRSAVPGAAENAAQSAMPIILQNLSNKGEALGPAECPIETISKNHRHQIILRGTDISVLRNAAANFIWGYTPPHNVYIEVDVDPVSLM